MAHTPGPWIADNVGIVMTPGRMPRLIAEVAGAGDRGRIGANAQLIAAAPDLLAACKALLTLWDARLPYIAPQIVEREVVTTVRDAIAKAEGKETL